MFDGDIAGLNDHPTSNDSTCFSLWRAKNQQKGALVATWDETWFTDADDRWKTLYRAQPDPTVLGGSYYWYLLEARLGRGGCDANGIPLQSPASAALNAFKVRSSRGDDPMWREGPWIEGSGPGYGGGAVSFIARDSVGGIAVRHTTGLLAPDTTYDGEPIFDFWIDVGNNPVEITLSEADADFTADGDMGACPGFTDPLLIDEKVPASAVGENGSIDYRLFWSGDFSQPAYHICDPSGGYDSTNPASFETRTFPTEGKPGLWLWEWRDVYTENNILVDPVSGSPLAFAVFGSPPPRGGRPPVGSAKPIGQWTNDPASMGPWLPLTVGEGSNSISIDMLDDALGLLAGGWPIAAGKKVTVCHHAPGNWSNMHAITVGAPAAAAHLAHGDDLRPPRLMARLKAEILVALLNIEAGSANGEDLRAAFVYGREENVGAVLDEAQAAVTDMTSACKLPLDQLDRLDLLVRLLGSINGGSVTWLPRPARASSPPTPFLPRARNAILRPHEHGVGY